MSYHNPHTNQDVVPDVASSSYVSDTATSYSGISNLTDNTGSRSGRASGHFTNRSDSSSLRRDREREGRCADCGAQTHDIRYEPETGSSRKVPLNIEGEVHRGRCLLCNPLPPRMSMHPELQQQQQPMFGGPHRGLGNMGVLESVHSGSSYPTQQYYPQDRTAYRGASSQASQSSASQSHHSTQGRSVGTAQTYNSAPAFGMGSHQSQHSNSNTFPLVVRRASNISRNSFDQPPVEEFTMHSSQGGQSHHHQHQQHEQQQHIRQQQHHDEEGSVTSGSSSLASHLNNVALGHNEEQSHEEENIREIISSMQQYPNHIPTQSKGMHSIWVLSWENANVIAIGRLGAIPIILDSMRLHPNTLALQSNGIATLQNLAMDGRNRDVIIESGGVALIVEVMAQFVQDKALQQSGCTALANLANGSAGQKSHVAESGGIMAMMRAVDAHRGDESILRAAYQALRKLGYNPG